jgi:hypothetical protein
MHRLAVRNVEGKRGNARLHCRERGVVCEIRGGARGKRGVQGKRRQRISLWSRCEPERVQVMSYLFKGEVEVVEAVMVAIGIMVHGKRRKRNASVRRTKRLATLTVR